MRGSSPTPSSDPEVARIEALVTSRLLGAHHEPRRIGRYVPLGRLGAGGMGVVYAAYDDRLDRRVAIKLVHADVATAALRKRLQREAQALAQVVHENVVRIYEIGEDRGRPFIVMEHVEGQTLRAWVRDSHASPRAIIENYRQAGRGLAAAHALGLVHRDFKPDNALVGVDGRVRVVDFGLARVSHDLDDEHRGATPREPPEGDPWSTPLTRTGAHLGTPAYMAPEQFGGGTVGAAADQFALCVALFEALWGQRPFVGDARALVDQALRTHVRALPSPGDLPPHLLSVLTRGLAVDPGARWPSMLALLDALGRDDRRRRRTLRIAASVVAVGVVAGGGVVARAELSRRDALASCERDADLGALWHDGVRASIDRSMLASGAEHAASSSEHVVTALDAYAHAWSDLRGDRCRATRVELTQTEDALDRAAWCLDERRLAFAALLEQLEQPSAETVAWAIPAAAALPPISACADTELLSRLPAPPTASRDRVAIVRAGIARADAIARAGRVDDAVTQARTAVADATLLDWPPVSAAAHDSLGRALAKSGSFTEAEAELTTAYFGAMDAGALDIAAAASTDLVRIVGVELARREDGLAWSRHAESVITALGDHDGLVTARWLEQTAQLRGAMVDFREAIALSERALAIRERLLGPDHPDTGNAHFALALAHEYGDEAAVRTHAERALAISERALGPDHPDLVERLVLVANSTLGDERLAAVQRAIDLGQRALGPDHPLVARALVIYGRAVYWRDGEAAAKPIVERALAIQVAKLGPRHPDIARTVNLLGVIADPKPEALAYYHRALAIAEENLGPTHPFVAPPLFNLAQFRQRRGEYDLARALMGRAAEVRKLAFGGDEPRYASYLLLRGIYERCDGDAAAARDTFAEVTRISEKHPPEDHDDPGGLVLTAAAALDTGDLEAARAAMDRALRAAKHCDAGREQYEPWAQWGEFVLARALWSLPPDRGRDRERAVALARDAMARLERPGVTLPDEQCTTAARQRARIAAWLDEPD